jgi:thiol-disulfide isomerase/thioredoxin
MPKEFWDRGQEYSVQYYDLFSTFKEVSNCSKLDSLGRFEIKVPLINSTEVFMDWKHTYINTVLEPGETYYLLYDFKSGHAIFMGKNCRLQNELLAHPIPMINADYAGKYENKVPAQEMMQILESRYKEAEGNLRKQIEKSAAISKCYQEYAAQYLLCTYASDILQGAYSVKDHIFPQEYVSQMEKIWKEIPQPYTQFRDYSMLTKDLIDQEARLKYSTPMGKTYGFLFTNYYPELLRKHKAQGDIAITDSEIATVEQWAKNLDSMTIKQYQTTDAKEQEKIENAFSNSVLAKRATAIIGREDIAKMLKDETPLIDVYYAQHIADSMGCSQQQKDVIITKAILQMLERLAMPLNSYGLDLVEHSISSEVLREKVLAEHRKYLSLQNRDITASIKTAPQDMSDGEKLLRHILEPYKGKLVLLDVWGTWCAPCKMALAHSKEEFERLAPYDVVYLYMASNSPEESWKNLIKLNNLVGDNIAHYNLPAAQQSAIENYLNIRSFPSYRLFDKEGNLVDVKVDARQLDNLEKIIKELNR